jgi:hypothetical protein
MQMRAEAREIMPEAFLDCVMKIPQPFFTPIYDFTAPAIVFGRVALVGDAAANARPHMGFGMAKAATDAQALAKQLSTHDDIDTALKAYNAERQPIGNTIVLHGRKLGCQLGSISRPTKNAACTIYCRATALCSTGSRYPISWRLISDKPGLVTLSLAARKNASGSKSRGFAAPRLHRFHEGMLPSIAAAGAISGRITILGQRDATNSLVELRYGAFRFDRAGSERVGLVVHGFLDGCNRRNPYGLCASFETSLRKRGNYGTARFSKTGAANLTIFIARRLPCFTSSAARSNSRRSRGYGPALPAPSRREDRAANRVRSHALSSPR